MARGGTPLVVLVLAAGQGTRLRSNTIKVLHDVAGQPMLAHVLRAAHALRPARTITVVGYQADSVRTRLGELGGHYVLQKQQRGTGHAVTQAEKRIGQRRGSVLLILNGDVPTLRTATLRSLVNGHRKSGAALTVLTAEIPDPHGYGRVIREGDGRVSRIVEQRDASAAERQIHEINTGIYAADPALLLPLLRRLRPNNAQGEYYLTDAVHTLLARGKRVAAVKHDDYAELLGVNTRQELAQAARTLYDRKAEALQDAGVTLLDAARTRIDPRARVGRDAVIHPDVLVEGSSTIGEGSMLRSGSRISHSRIGRGVEIKDHCVLLEAVVGDEVAVGPFAHLRPGTVLMRGSKVGNFVELKNTRLGPGSKASHLSYLGDARIGADCNIGAGTITCNYDGKRKHRTVLGRGVFIGSNSQLVAPVTLGSRAYVAAGSTVTEKVPSGALAVARSRQVNVKGWVSRNEQRLRQQERAAGRSSRKR